MASKAWFGADHETAESLTYVGLAQSQAIEMARQANVEFVRVLEGRRGTYTFDFRPTRLTLLVSDERAAFF
jgi:hypothetical protein